MLLYKLQYTRIHTHGHLRVGTYTCTYSSTLCTGTDLLEYWGYSATRSTYSSVYMDSNV